MVRGQRSFLPWFDSILSMAEMDVINWLMRIKLMKDKRRCLPCGRWMTLRNRSSRSNIIWHCDRCKNEFSIRRGSIFFTARRVPIKVFLKVMYCWAHNIRYYHAGTVSTKTVCKIKRKCTQAVLQSLVREPIQFEQHGVYAVDESSFSTRKHHRGRVRPKRWVFGMVDMNIPTKPIFLHVPSRDAQTLQAIIRDHIPPGSTIVSDGWRAYLGIDTVNNYQHLVVNHQQNFVDPITGAHTNTIECAWRHAKEYCLPKKPQTLQALQTLLYEYMWRCWRGQRWPGGYFVRLLHDVKFMH